VASHYKRKNKAETNPDTIAQKPKTEGWNKGKLEKIISTVKKALL